MKSSKKVIAFDADDTLWVNEPYFREAESKFAKLLSIYKPEDEIQKELYSVITGNIQLYGFGVKSCILSMIEYATKISKGNIPPIIIQQILNIGKNMLNKPVELLPGVKDTLTVLSKKYKLVVLTKGDLLDQEKKLERSGLLPYFHHVEVMSDKKTEDYQKVLKHLDIETQDFVMIGNSLKSDIFPVAKIGATAIYIPFHSIWKFETVDQEKLKGITYKTLTSIKEIVNIL